MPGITKKLAAATTSNLIIIELHGEEKSSPFPLLIKASSWAHCRNAVPPRQAGSPSGITSTAPFPGRGCPEAPGRCLNPLPLLPNWSAASARPRANGLSCRECFHRHATVLLRSDGLLLSATVHTSRLNLLPRFCSWLP